MLSLPTAVVPHPYRDSPYTKQSGVLKPQSMTANTGRVITRTSHYGSFTVSGTGYNAEWQWNTGHAHLGEGEDRVRAVADDGRLLAARGGNQRFWRLSTLRAHTKAP